MSYLSRERWNSFWYQLMEVTETKPSSVLEIGSGPKIVGNVVKQMGAEYVDLDIDFTLHPIVVGDATELPFSSNAFDCILIAEVLEHIPFEEVKIALSELSRVAKKAVVITLPHFHHFVPSIALKLFPFVPRFQKVFPISFPRKHEFDGQHYWEIGKSHYSLSKIRQILVDWSGMNLIKDYLIEENPFHHVFVLKSRTNLDV